MAYGNGLSKAVKGDRSEAEDNGNVVVPDTGWNKSDDRHHMREIDSLDDE